MTDFKNYILCFGFFILGCGFAIWNKQLLQIDTTNNSIRIQWLATNKTKPTESTSQANTSNMIKERADNSTSTEQQIPTFPIEPATPLIHDKAQYAGKSYRELLASTATRADAFKMLNAVPINEQETVRFMIITDMIIDGWSLSKATKYQDNLILLPLLQNTWSAHSDIIAAANCTYCGNHFQLINELIRGFGITSYTAQKLLSAHPRYIKLLLSDHKLDIHIQDKLLRSMAQLEYSGDQSTTQFFGSLISHDANLHRKWDKTGSYEDLAQIPLKEQTKLNKNLLFTYWQDQIARGTVNVDLTLTLAQQGHRPALRWIIWLLDSKADYLLTYNRGRVKPKLIPFIKGYVDFSNPDIANGKFDYLSTFYSNNWKSIYWNNTTLKWTNKNK